MTSSPKPSPILTYKTDGTPYSEKFNDIYFDSESGSQQSKNIFIDGNNISAKIKDYNTELVIGETGFGTGLNFILTLQAYQKLNNDEKIDKVAKIHFISVEKYPLTKQQLVQSLQALPKLKKFANLLINQYPDIKYNDHAEIEYASKTYTATFFDGQIKLTLIFDDATKGLSTLTSGKQGLVNAWYLDGFSPAKNPSMWCASLFEQIARLSMPQASIATFTVAGFVNRHLKAIGFRTYKKPYKGNKKEILTGIFQQNPKSRKGYQLRPRINKPQHVTIVGGGIASACAAYALIKQGVKVTLYSKDKSLAEGGSSNAIGALYPLLRQRKDKVGLFYQQALGQAKKLYNQLNDDGFTFPHQWCGLLDIAYTEALAKRQTKFAQTNPWPHTLIHGVNAQEASAIANVSLPFGGLFIPEAGWVSPQDVVKQLIKSSQRSGQLKVKYNVHVTKIDSIKNKNNKKWRLSTNKGNFDTQVLVLCGGAEMIDLDYIKQLPFSCIQGQVTCMKTNSTIKKLSTVICHKGYLTPSITSPSGEVIHCIGATFNKNSTQVTTTDEDDSININTLKKCLPKLSEKVNWTKQDVSASRARLRCMTPDHLPMVGAMPDVEAHHFAYPHLAKDKNWPYQQAAPIVDNLYVMMGFGARGLCSAPLAANILAADLCGLPYPVDDDMLFHLSPNRFAIKDIIKQKTKV